MAKLQDNFSQVVAIAMQVEKRLVRLGKRAEYDDEIRSYLGRGAFIELERDKMKNWQGPINYISHHGVLKPSSTSTKLRIVSNSSLNNHNMGLSLNDCLPKGPNSLETIANATIL